MKEGNAGSSVRNILPDNVTISEDEVQRHHPEADLAIFPGVVDSKCLTSLVPASIPGTM